MDNLRDEIWKDIEGYEGYYQVSNMGRVRSLDRLDSIGRNRIGKIFVGSIKNGYKFAFLSINGIKNGEYFHRLVAKAFIENKENKSEINHKDHDRLNNVVDNLEWCSRSENMIAAIKFGNRDHCIKSVLKIDINTNKVLAKFKSMHEASRDNEKFHYQLISHCCNGRRKTHAGYKWRYAEEVK